MKIIRNALWSLGGFGVSSIIHAIFFFLLARILGSKEFGAFSASLAIIQILIPFATWGAGSILVKNVARDREKFYEYFGSAILSIIIFGSISFLFSLLLYFLILSDKVNILPVILLGLSELFFYGIVSMAMQAYQAFELMPRIALIQFIYSLNRLLFCILFIFLIYDHSFSTWSILYLTSTLITATVCLVIIRIELGRPRYIFSTLKNNLLEGFYFSLSSSSQSIYNNFDKSILPKYTALEISGNYSVAYKCIDIFCIPMRALLQTVYPKFFQKGAESLIASKKFAFKLFPAFISYSVFAVIVLTIFSKMIPGFFGSNYNEAENIIRTISPIIIFRSIHSLGADALTGAGLQGKRSAAQVSVSILNATLCLILIPTKGWLGAAWASLISDGILAILIWGIIIFISSNNNKKILPHNENNISKIINLNG